MVAQANLSEILLFYTFVRWTYQLFLTLTREPTTCPTTWAAECIGLISWGAPASQSQGVKRPHVGDRVVLSLGSVVSLPREVVCPCNISYRVELSLGSVDVGGAPVGAHHLKAAVLARNLLPQPVGDIQKSFLYRKILT